MYIFNFLESGMNLRFPAIGFWESTLPLCFFQRNHQRSWLDLLTNENDETGALDFSTTVK